MLIDRVQLHINNSIASNFGIWIHIQGEESGRLAFPVEFDGKTLSLQYLTGEMREVERRQIINAAPWHRKRFPLGDE